MKFLTTLSAFALVAGLGFAPLTASADNMMGMHGTTMGHHRCPKGSHWVAPYQKKNGQWVKGYCRHKR